MKNLIFSLFILLFLGCSPVKIYEENSTAVSTIADEVVFMSFKIKKESGSNTSSISFINTIKTSAKIKKIAQVESSSGNYLIAEIFTQGKAVETIEIAHPLFVRYEYADDSGKYISKEAVLEEAEFFVRFQNNGSNKIKLSESLKDQPKKEILTLNF